MQMLITLVSLIQDVPEAALALRLGKARPWAQL